MNEETMNSETISDMSRGESTTRRPGEVTERIVTPCAYPSPSDPSGSQPEAEMSSLPFLTATISKQFQISLSVSCSCPGTYCISHQNIVSDLSSTKWKLVLYKWQEYFLFVTNSKILFRLSG